MNSENFNNLRDAMFEHCISLTKKKGEDYTKGNVDVLVNFKEGDFLGISPEKTLGVYMKKHIDAIFNHIKTGGQSESEPISERITDAINYLVFLQALIVDSDNEIPDSFKEYMSDDDGTVVNHLVDKKEDPIDINKLVSEIEDGGSDIEFNYIEENTEMLLKLLEETDKETTEVEIDESVFHTFRFNWIKDHNILITDPTKDGIIYQIEVNEYNDHVCVFIYKIDKTRKPIDKFIVEEYISGISELMRIFGEFVSHKKEAILESDFNDDGV